MCLLAAMMPHIQVTLKIAAVRSSELLVKICHITIVRRHITEHGNLLRPTLKLSPCLLKFIGSNLLCCEVRCNEDF
jgi:hypothetical protein